jgi:putative SOS response-associated peptidase YedK
VLYAERDKAGGSSSGAASGGSDGGITRVLKMMRWGVIPHWSKEWPDYSNARNTINARDDTVSSGKGMWASMRDKKRCVIPIEGFYEWQRLGENEKIKLPHYVEPDIPKDSAEDEKEENEPPLLLCAGLYDRATLADPDDASQTVDVWTFTIITTNNSKQIEFLHDRMPVILKPEDVDTWLDPSVPFQKVAHLLKPKEDGLRVYPVTSFVSKIGQDSEECIRPATDEEVRIMKLGKGALGAEKGLQSIGNFFTKKEAGVKEEKGKEKVSVEAPKAFKRPVEERSDDDDVVIVRDKKEGSMSPKPDKKPAPSPKPLAPATPAAKKQKSSASTPKANAKSPDPNQKSLTSFFTKK